MPHFRVTPPFDWWKWCEQERFDRAQIALDDALVWLASGLNYAAIRLCHRGALVARATLHLVTTDGPMEWQWSAEMQRRRGAAITETRGNVPPFPAEEPWDHRDRAALALTEAFLPMLRGLAKS
jgi:hypothetical protein